MKKIPLTIVPFIILVLITIAFIRLPKGSYLVSDAADTLIGIIVGITFISCIGLDVLRFSKEKPNSK